MSTPYAPVVAVTEVRCGAGPWAATSAIPRVTWASRRFFTLTPSSTTCPVVARASSTEALTSVAVTEPISEVAETSW